MATRINGFTVGYTVAGAIVLWSGIKGWTLKTTARDLLSGKTPPTNEEPITATSGPTSSAAPDANIPGVSSPAATSASNKANQALGRLMAAGYGWGTGAEWTALNNIVMAESGWDATAANPTSDARGIAQNINGWGPDYQPGNARQQIAWLLNYIKGRYGDPINAWNFHLANGWY